MSSQEWKKEIAKCFNQDSGMSPEEAKIAFLKVRLVRSRYKCKYLNLTQHGISLIKILRTKVERLSQQILKQCFSF